jgi:myo-inositol 2-dehydrogenase/D-chiro-inositol 1-dehydrogenase
VAGGYTPYGSAFDRFAAGYAGELDHFLEVAADQTQNACTPRDALNTLLVAEAAERSRRAGAPVPVRRADELLA